MSDTMDVHDDDAEKQCYVVIPTRKSRTDGKNRLVFALIIQGFLLALSLAISIYSLGTVKSVDWNLDQGKDIGIYLEVVGEVIKPTEQLKFSVHWQHWMKLEGNTKISFQCSGPYVVHVSACYLDQKNQKINGSLILQQPGTDWKEVIPLHSQDDCKDKNPQKDARMLSFTKRDNVTLKFTSESPSIRLKHLLLGFHYLLGEKHCKLT